MIATRPRRSYSAAATSLRRTLFLCGSFVILLLAAGPSARGQQLTCAPWDEIPEFKGTITVNGRGTMVDSTGTETITINESATMTVDAITNVLSCSSSILWPSQTNVSSVTYSINDRVTDPCPEGGSQYINSTGSVTTTASAINYVYVAFAPGGGVFNFLGNTYSVAINSDSVPGQQTAVGCDGSQSQLSNVVFFGPYDYNNNLWIYNIPLPTTIGPLTGTTTVTSTAWNGHPGVVWTLSWNLVPIQNFDVIVSIPNYDTWRPTAGVLESDTGAGINGVPGILSLGAQLVDKTTGLPVSGVTPDKITFTLSQVSQEPGVVLNWPSQREEIKKRWKKGKK